MEGLAWSGLGHNELTSHSSHLPPHFVSVWNWKYFRENVMLIYLTLPGYTRRERRGSRAIYNVGWDDEVVWWLLNTVLCFSQQDVLDWPGQGACQDLLDSCNIAKCPVHCGKIRGTDGRNSALQTEVRTFFSLWRSNYSIFSIQIGFLYLFLKQKQFEIWLSGVPQWSPCQTSTQLSPVLLYKISTHNSIKISGAIKQKVISVKKIKTSLKRSWRIHEKNLLNI